MKSQQTARRNQWDGWGLVVRQKIHKHTPTCTDTTYPRARKKHVRTHFEKHKTPRFYKILEKPKVCFESEGFSFLYIHFVEKLCSFPSLYRQSAL